MEELNFIEQLKELTSQQDLVAVSRDVSELKSKFEDYVLEEERKLQIAQIEALENGTEAPEAENDFGKEEFYSIFNEYKERKKSVVDEIHAVESKNLHEKLGLIERLRHIITNEENIGAAFGAFKEIQDNWKEIGDIPRNKRNDIQAEYSRLLEDFFYNIKIYKELKDHDFHRNFQLKQDVIAKLKSLHDVQEIKEVEQQLKSLQHDWEDIGPVHNEEWENLKGAYWTEVRSVYDRVNRFYEDRRSQQLENLNIKQELLKELQNILPALENLNSAKDWDEKTQFVLDIQEKWKNTGFGPKKENDAIWKVFRATCDTFFDTKKEFFDKINVEFDHVAKAKMNLIEQAENLKNSEEWVETANSLIRLQKEWKKLGHAGKKYEQKLWKKFRTICDEFFDRRQKHFNELDSQFEGNLTEKIALIEEIEKYQVPEDHQQALSDLKTFATRFNEIGKVPQKNQTETYNRYKKAIDQHYTDLKMDGTEKERVMFQMKIETLKGSPEAKKMLGEVKFELRKEIEKLQKEILQLENNLGFFRGAEALKKDVEKKINRAKEKIEINKSKIKLIPNE